VPRKPDYGAFERVQTSAMLHSTAHWQKTVMGYSSIRPLVHEQLFEELNRFPDAASVQRLQDLGVDYVVVHTEDYAYENKDWQQIEPRFAQFGLRFVHAEGAGRVYAMPALPPLRRP
jgi:hypothetical protein